MAEGKGFRGDGIRVDRIYERSRIEEAVLASAYEVLVPTQRWGLVPNRQRMILWPESSSRGISVQREAELRLRFGG